MTKKETYTDSASHNAKGKQMRGTAEMKDIDKDRMLDYKTFAVSFSYPDDKFFDFFPDLVSRKEKIVSEYDKLFRVKEVWLYGTEYMANHEFQRANYLSEINGFYKAFGTEPDRDRPDSLANELEFMYFLIFKRLFALENKETENAEEKATICHNAEIKFFNAHLYPAAQKIAEKLNAQPEADFYKEKIEEMLEFLEKEKSLLKGS